MTRLENLQRKQAHQQQPLKMVGSYWVRHQHYLQGKQGKHRFVNKKTERIAAAAAAAATPPPFSMFGGFRQQQQQQQQQQQRGCATVDERRYHEEFIQHDPLYIDIWTKKAMRLAVLDRIMDSHNSSSSSTTTTTAATATATNAPPCCCTLLAVIAALKSDKAVFDLYSLQQQQNEQQQQQQQKQQVGWPSSSSSSSSFRLQWGRNSKRTTTTTTTTQTQYKLMKALETIEHDPSASQTYITSWEEAQKELEQRQIFIFQEDEDDDNEEEPSHKLLLLPSSSSSLSPRMNLMEQTFTSASRKIHQKLNALSQATLSKRIHVVMAEDHYNDDDDSNNNISADNNEYYSHLDRADVEFLVRFRQEQNKLFGSKKLTAEAVLRAEAKLVEQEQRRVEEEEEAARQAEARERASDLMRPLTKQEEERIHQALYERGPADQVIAQIGADSVQRGSIQRLLPGQWLNDEVIHFFLTVLAKRDEVICKEDQSRKRSHFFKSFFMTTLTNEGHSNPALDGTYEYKNVKRWSKKVPGKDLFQLDKVFFPINQGGMHWVCAVAYMQERRIQFYDSLGSSGSMYLQHVLRYLQDEHQDKKKCPLQPAAQEWKLVPCDSATTPRQLNGYDCGVFVCMFIDFLSKDCPLLFGQDHITQCRERIALSILNGTAIM